MKKSKKLMCLALSAAFAVSALAGCGNSGKGSSSEPTYKIGAIGPVTGSAGAYGEAVKKGAQLAADEINANGGINGAKIEFKFEDDENDAEKAVNAYNTLKDWGMQMLMGTVTSAPCIAVESEAANDNMFLLTPSGTAVDCISGSNAFRVCFSDPAQGTKSAEYISENNIATKVACIYDSSDPYSSGIYQNFAAAAPDKGMEVVAAEAFTADSKTDFKVQLQKVKDSGAELVFLPIYYTEAALLLQQAKDINFSPIFFGCDGLDGLLDVENFDASLAEGVMLLTPFAADAEDEKTQQFVKAYSEKYNEAAPIQFAADAYDAIYTIKAAAEEAGTKADMSNSDLCDALVAAMPKITVEGVTGTITWAEDGEPDKEPKAVKIESGAYVAL
ncbi:MAG: ABC transporter substrate-binding protein [Lachnospiraceae bacterium]|nr:ABC transporter substrate-binding protein [Lachnospiraceae bacterium]